MELVKVLAFIGFGLAVGQIYVYFSLREFWRDNDVSGQFKQNETRKDK